MEVLGRRPGCSAHEESGRCPERDLELSVLCALCPMLEPENLLAPCSLSVPKASTKATRACSRMHAAVVEGP